MNGKQPPFEKEKIKSAPARIPDRSTNRDRQV
jgi:hypothetical protein